MSASSMIKDQNVIVNLLNVEDYALVWLDSNVNKTDDCLNTITYLRHIFGNLITFEDYGLCLEYIAAMEAKKIFLIVSGSMGELIVPHLQEQSRIISIYIFCVDTAKHEKWAKSYSKVRGIFTDKEMLLSKLCMHVASRFNESALISIFNITDSKEKSIRDLNLQSTMFVWFQQLTKLLLHMPQTNESKAEMLNFCKLVFQNDQGELEKIEQFEEYYESTNAIFWYTRDCFLYRLLNRALRTEDISIIYRFRFFIRDLHEQLLKLSNAYVQTLSSVTLYRGQRMSSVEVKTLKENIGNLVSMNTFLSATTNKAVAIWYAGNRSDSPFIAPVLFEINIDMTKISDIQPFANITDYSYFNDENEILFSMGTVFQIESIVEIDDGILNVQLTPQSLENSPSKPISDYFKSHFVKEETTLTDLAKYLLLMGDCNKAIEYLEVMLNELRREHSDTCYIYSLLGKAYLEEENYDMALFHFENALEFQESSKGTNYLSLFDIYGYIGDLNNRIGSNHIALRYYEEQLNISLSSPEEDLEEIMEIQRKITKITENSSKKNVVTVTNQEVPDHIRVDKPIEMMYDYFKVGEICIHEGNYKSALASFGKGLEIALNSVTPKQNALASYYLVLGGTQFKIGKYDDALISYQKVHEVHLKKDFLEPWSLAADYDRMALVYIAKTNYTKGIEYHKKAIELASMNVEEHTSDTAEYFEHLGNAYYKHEKYEEAIRQYEIAREIYMSCTFPNLTAIARISLQIGSCYNVHLETNYEIAKRNYGRALDICRASLFEDNNVLSTVYSYIANACHNNNDFEEAIQYYENAIEMKITCDPPNMEHIAHNYGCIAIVYKDLGNSIMAIENFKKAIEFALKSGNGNQLMELYFHMAVTYTETGYKDEALYTFNLLLQQVGDLTSPDGLTVASTYYCISKIYYDKKEYSLSIDNSEKAIEVGTVYSLSDEFMIHYYAHLAEGYLNNDELDKAIYNFELSIRLEENSITPNLKSVANKYNRLGRIYFTKGDYERSLYYWKEKALALRLAYLTPDHVDIGRSYDNIGKVFASKRDYEQALDLYKQAIDIFSQSGSDADSANTYKNLSELYESEKKYTDALAYAEKAFECGERSLPSNSQTLVQYSARVTAAKNKIISSSSFLRCLALILSQPIAVSIIFKSKI